MGTTADHGEIGIRDAACWPNLNEMSKVVMNKMAAQEDRISEFDFALLPELSAFLGIDTVQFAKEMEEGFQKEREKMQKGFNSHMRSEAKRLKSFVTYEHYSSWTPQEMAAAGFYFTGVKSGIQCFCCSLILFAAGIHRLPIELHKKFRPCCEFLLGKDVGNVGKYDIRVKNPENMLRGDKARYQEDRARLESFQNWPFYVQAVSVRDLSAAGFVFTGKRDTVQCFSCGGCLGNWEEGDDPWKEHAKWFPTCELLQSKKSSEEIAQYIQSYKGFVGVTGEHFVNSWVKRELPMVSVRIAMTASLLMKDYDWILLRAGPTRSLQEFQLWSEQVFSIQCTKDIVQCFFCGGCMENWKEGDDPLEDHAKYFPNCQFLQNLKSCAEGIPDDHNHCELSELTDTTSESYGQDSAAVSSVVPAAAQGEAQWLQEAKNLSEQLRESYTSASFRHMCLLEASPSLATDHLLGCDLALALKHISSPVEEPVVLPEVFANLNSVMCVEGEASSGKTVLLKKIALLWASGCCPLLNRFQLVFYLSLSSTRLDQGLATMICDQLLKTEGSVTETCLRNIIEQLKNQVLLLLDDYREMCSVPQVIEKLIQKNHSRSCLLVGVHTNRARDIRRYLDTILEIKVFPFYNTMYLLRKLFSHDMSCLRKFMVYFRMSESLRGIHKTPLFVTSLCANWLQYPLNKAIDGVAVFKSYIECLFLKHKSKAELVRATVSSCGELGLKGLFSSCFEFSDDDLTEAGIDEREGLVSCLLSKFTAQRLRPVYQFLNPAFQEFLAGKRLIELLDSDRQEDQDLGLSYLKRINSSVKAVGLYSTLLNYVSCHPSTKAGPKIVSHLLHLADSKESLEIILKNNNYLKHHPEISEQLECMRSVWQVSPESYFSIISNRLLSLAIKIAYQSHTVAACSPFILQFLQGKTLNLDVLNLPYFFDHPESLLLLRSIQVSIRGNEVHTLDLSILETCIDKSQAPTVDQDCVSAFESVSEWKQDIAEKEENIKHFENLRLAKLPDISSGYWHLSPKQYKIPLLEVHVSGGATVNQEMLRVLTVIFSASQCIELHVQNSGEFMAGISPALEQSKDSVTKCSVFCLELSTAEQELLLTLPALESLQVLGTRQVPGKLLTNLDKFLCLKELSVDLHHQQNVFALIPEGFFNLHRMEKLLIQISAEYSPSKLVKLIQNSPNLHVFHLQFTALPNFISLKILSLKNQQFPDKETSEKFAYTLGSLNNLEELELPTGDGIQQVAKLIIQQCQHLQFLRILSLCQILDDDSVMEIAKVAIDGGFQKLEDLNLSVNHKITEEGYRNFFQALDNMPHLKELTISRHFTKCIKAQATTVKSLSQCMLRLPSLIRLNMLSWLLDTEDITLLTAMKERHPQSKRLFIHRKWVLPFSPTVQE
ncbi:baculoviral IAP repeat-containing protein 1 [Prionailurus iriomotensis]